MRAEARRRLHACLLQPDTGNVPKAQLQHRFQFAGLDVEHLQWQLPYGPPTEAYVEMPCPAESHVESRAESRAGRQVEPRIESRVETLAEVGEKTEPRVDVAANSEGNRPSSVNELMDLVNLVSRCVSGEAAANTSAIGNPG